MAVFEKEFMLGAATAAHQVEGDNRNSDCWVMEHVEHSMYDEPSLDAVDHYHRYGEDIAYMAKAGLNTYRFSIEWARIQPEADTWDEKEIQHYREMIQCCKKHSIRPMVTLHHFSSPAWLVRLGGWENPKVADYFTAYCKRVAEEFGSELEYVCTINEANMRLQLASLIKDMMKRMGSESEVQVGVNLSMNRGMAGMMECAKAFGLADPREVHNFVSMCTPEGDLLVMKAHQAAKAVLKEKCPHLKVGLTLSLHDMQPGEDGEEHAAKEWEDEFMHYLPYIKDDDFLGVQCYSTKRFNSAGVAGPMEGVPVTQMGYEDSPLSIANTIRAVGKEFKGEMIVTENGIATEDDNRRCAFIKEAMAGIAACIKEGYKVKGYLYWSLLDNFEWQKGYSKTFGLIAVDRSTQTRYPKESLRVLGSFVEKQA